MKLYEYRSIIISTQYQFGFSHFKVDFFFIYSNRQQAGLDPLVGRCRMFDTPGLEARSDIPQQLCEGQKAWCSQFSTPT